MRIAIACGGSGGHIFPALAVARVLKRDGSEVIIFTPESKLDRRITEGCEFEFCKIEAYPAPRIFSVKIISAIMKLIRGIASSLRALKKKRIDVVVGFGGYPSVPVVLAGYLLRRPVVIHEQNVVPGRATKLLSLFAAKIAVSFADTQRYLKKSKIVVTGNPVREEFFNLDAEKSIKILGLSDKSKRILILGGSKGSISVNGAVVDALKICEPDLCRDIAVIHITGSADREAIAKAYSELSIEAHVYDFIEHPWWAFGASNLVISRSGAGAVSEIIAAGVPSILIPYPYAGGHQLINAQYLERLGACEVIEEKALTGRSLYSLLMNMLYSPDCNKSMRDVLSRISSRHCAEEIAKLVLSLS